MHKNDAVHYSKRQDLDKTVERRAIMILSVLILLQLCIFAPQFFLSVSATSTRTKSITKEDGDVERENKCSVGLPYCPIGSTSTTTSQPQQPSPTQSTKPTSIPTSSTTRTTTPTTTASTQTTTVTPPGVQIDSPEDEDPSPGGVHTSDSLYTTPGAVQIKCTDVGVNCTNCTWLDWLQIYNKSIDSDSPALITLPDSSETDCFQRCDIASCVGFIFNSSNKSCNIFERVNFEDVYNDTDSSLFVRIAPKITFLDEWLLTLNKIPRGEPFSSATVNNFLNCTLSCAAAVTDECVFATLNRTSMTCNLYTRRASKIMASAANVISIQHSSLSQPGNVWRFGALGPIYQKEESPNSYTAESTESCLEDCYSDDSCQLATITAVGGSSTTVDCFLYDFYDDIWYEDDPPTKATNSYYKFVPKNNTLYRKYPHFHRVHQSSDPIDEIESTSLENCKERALRSSNCYYFSFNSTSQTCQIYDDTARAETTKSSTEFDLATFSKTIPNDQLSYYNFEPYWASSISIYQDASEDYLNGNACLEKCNQDEISKCAAVAIQRPEGNCTFYGIPELNQTLLDHNRTEGEEGAKSIQVFLRLRDLSTIHSPEKYRCFDNQSVSWSDLNQIIQSSSLDGRWDELPEGNNAPLTPHGPGFEGQGNNSAASSSSRRRYPLPQKSVGTDDDTDEPSPRWERLSKETQDSISKFNRNLFGSLGGLAGYAGGFATGAAVGKNGQAAFGGGAVGAYLGKEIGEGFGKVVDKLIDWGDAAICWLDNLFTGGCTGKKKEEESCTTTCLSRSIDRFFDLVRAISCTCDNEPDIKIEGKSMELLERLQDIHDRGCAGRRVRSSCGICCRAGYNPETPFLFCSCPAGGGDPEWVPDEGRCEPQQDCTLADDGDWFGESMPRIPVRDCSGIAYYGSVFSLTRKIPFFTAYHFSQRNTGNVFGKKRKEFKAYPCEERNIRSNQLTRRIINGAGYKIGHFGNHADLRFRIDAGYANAYFINVAPQDGYSNHPAWEAVENRLRDLFSESYSGGGIREGIIITGVCFSATPGDSFPTCFWKLACTRNDRGVVTVAAFYHQNILSPKSNPNSQRDRRQEVYQIRDQSFVAGLLGFANMDQVWDESGDFFTIGPGPPFTVMQCAGAQHMNFPPVRPFPPVRADEDEEDYELFNFWHEKVFGEGFADTVAQIMNETESDVEQNESGSAPSCGKKVVGYVTGWSDVKFTWSAASYLTHAIFAFIQMRGDGTLVVGSADPDNSMDVSVDTQKSYLRLYEMKRAKERSRQRLRTMFTIFAVGGWANSQYFSSVAASSAMTQTFIRSALEIIDYFDMDGIDIDWEYPVTGGAQVGVQADRENYLTFLRAIRSALNDHEKGKGRYVPYTLTIAGAAGSWVLEDGFDLPAIAEVVDWINVMTYDYFGAWDSQWGAYTGPHAPLYFGAPQGYSGKTNVDYTLKYYSCRIQNPQKLVMGLGFYGRFWNHSGSPVGDDPLWRKATPNGQGTFDGGFEPWRNIAKMYLGPGASYQKSWHEKTQTPYLDDSSGFLMGYEDPRSIAEKVKYAAAKNFGGVMMWAIDLDDDENTMLRTASSELLCSASSDIPSEYKCPPIQEKRWWTVEDDEKKAGMCGKSAPLYNDYYPVCDPEDPGYACCSASGFCGSGEKFCECDGCVDYYNFPEKILDEPVKPSGPVRWHTMDKFEPGPQCGYEGHKLENGDYAICNPDDNNGYCCSNAGYCGKTDEFCTCEGCVNFRESPDYEYPEKTWIDSGEDAGKCGDNAPQVNGKKATCNPLSKDYYCCSASGYCGSGADYCDCDGCVNYKN